MRTNRFYSRTRLQLITTAGLDNTLLFLLLSLIKHTLSDGLRALPAESLKTLRQMRVGEVVASIHPIGIHGAEVLDLELEEGAGKQHGVAELLRERIGFELKLAGDDVHAKLDDQIHGGEGIGEEEETNNDGVFGEETEGRVERVVVDENREESEDV